MFNIKIRKHVIYNTYQDFKIEIRDQFMKKNSVPISITRYDKILKVEVILLTAPIRWFRNIVIIQLKFITNIQ